MSERPSLPAADLIDIQIGDGGDSENRGFPLVLRSTIRAFFHLLTFGLIPENPRTVLRVYLRESGELIHETDWGFDAGGASTIADQMQSDANYMSLAEFCAEWNIPKPDTHNQ